MSDLTDARDLLATAHKNHADLFPKLIDIHLSEAGSPITGGTGLSAIIRQPSKQEAEILSGHHGINATRIFEVAVQGAFTRTIAGGVRPLKHKVKDGGVLWEIKEISTDDSGVTVAGIVEAAVYVFMCGRMQSGGIGEISL